MGNEFPSRTNDERATINPALFKTVQYLLNPVADPLQQNWRGSIPPIVPTLFLWVYKLDFLPIFGQINTFC